jgi:aminopeptidase 2
VQSLFKPLVDRLGFEYKETDSAADTQLRTMAIAQAAGAKDEECASLPLWPVRTRSLCA